jgi:Fic family protein
MVENNYISQKVTVFHDRKAPEAGFLVGYAKLIDIIENETNSRLILPYKLSICTDKYQRYDAKNWQVFTIRHKPEDTISNHLIFALKYEGIDLFLIKNIFKFTGEDVVKFMIENEPTSQYTRRVWFLYEWLFGKIEGIKDLDKGTYVEIVNTKLQFGIKPTNSTRHRVKNNLPGIPEFCPMIYKTKKLENYINKNLSTKIDDGLDNQSVEIIKRTAAFLLLKDSRASFAIEGEFPHNQRARNWSKAIGQAGKLDLTIEEIERLQNIVIGSKKLKHMGIRNQEGFIGEHDRENFYPIPEHISAKAEDLKSLLSGLFETNNILQHSGFDPVLTAAIISFGFVFIHPLSDGNGRIHRYLIHHILTKTGYTKRDMIFPVSSAFLDKISDYQDILESYSTPRIDLIEWEETEDHNVRILNDTADLYRYVDFTVQAEFLFECVEDTIDRIIPNEIDYLKKYDKLNVFINNLVVLPNTKIDLLIKLLFQNEGKLSKNKRQKEFEELTDKDISDIEKQFKLVFRQK